MLLPLPFAAPPSKHDVLCHDLGHVPLHSFLVVVGARLQAPFRTTQPQCLMYIIATITARILVHLKKNTASHIKRHEFQEPPP